jgi:transcriptional regulator GlxA family with amidase domain
MMTGEPAVIALRDATDRYLEACFEKETPPHASELAAILNILPHQLTRLFRREIGITPSAYLKSGQIRRAQDLLRTTELSMNSVGYASGFGTRMSFFRAFRRATGVTPADYRASTRRDYK